MGLQRGVGASSYATGFGFYPVGRREPLKVIGQGSDRTGEALYGDDTGSVCTGLETGDRQGEAAATWEARAVEGTREGTGSSQLEEAALRAEGGGGQRKSQRGLGLGAGVTGPPRF